MPNPWPRARLEGDALRSEVFRVLRANLLIAMADLERPTVIVTSALPGEGKTVTCASLAASLATAGSRVVVVDVDLRHPDVHSLFGGSNEVGLSDVLLDRVELESALQFIEIDETRGLYLLPTGPPVSNPTELVGGARMARLLDNLARQADVVLLDTPPVLPVADTLVIGRMAGGAIIVIEARTTPQPAVEQAKAALTRSQTRLLGVVLNKAQHRDQRLASSRYGWGYGYGYEPTDDTAGG